MRAKSVTPSPHALAPHAAPVWRIYQRPGRTPAFVPHGVAIVKAAPVAVLQIERGARQIAGVEVKAGGTVTASDFRGLRKLAGAAGARFAGGVVLYDGETSASFGDRLHAVPISRLWAGP